MRNRFLQTVQNGRFPFISGRSNNTIPTIYSVLVASTYGKSVFVKKLIFSQNQDAPYVFEQKNQKKRGFCEKLTLSANAYRENEKHNARKGENALTA